VNQNTALPFLQVTCALILHQNKILAAQRSSQMSHPGKWEFPGGKCEQDETLEACIKREIREELGIEIQIMHALSAHSHQYADKKIQLWPFLCSWSGGQLQASEHAQLLWCEISQLLELDWLAADLPILKQALAHLKSF
jgi:8-oxo-dGTP diphosphatase